ncbi:MAG: hypothetical protein HRT38_13560 [Alteromonadaceae bacterium]|nr:hypothetical protein [Alteromonadaceae bacterium]
MSGRSTIKYPTDILIYINKMRKNNEKLTINQALFELARGGMAKENIVALNEFQDIIMSMDSQLKLINEAIIKPNNTELFSTKTYGILRRFIYETEKELLPLCDDTANILYEKSQGQ